MNGFSDEGCKAISDSLATNSTLIELDISRNRVGEKGAYFLFQGLIKNETLQILRV